MLVIAAGCGGKESDSPKPKSPASQAKPLIRFQDDNFGATFSHSDVLSTTYNPHGGADVVLIHFEGKPIGGLKIGSRPPAGSERDFLEAGKEYYRDRYSATVTYEFVTNPKGYGFHHLTAKSTAGKKPFVIERYVYLRDKSSASPDTQPEKAVLDAMSGSFSFEFVVADEAKDRLAGELRTVIDTFEIVPKP